MFIQHLTAQLVHLSELSTENCKKIDPYCHRQQCSLGFG